MTPLELTAYGIDAGLVQDLYHSNPESQHLLDAYVELFDAQEELTQQLKELQQEVERVQSALDDYEVLATGSTIWPTS